MTRLSAMVRGGVAAAGWAAALCAVATAATRASGASAGSGYAREFLQFFGARLDVALAIAPAAFVAGALVGLLGRIADAPPPWVRTVFLWLAFFPAVGVGFAAVTWLVGLVAPPPGVRTSLLETALLLPKAVMLVTFFGVPWFAPGLALPLLGAAASVERWTRPARSAAATDGPPAPSAPPPPASANR